MNLQELFKAVGKQIFVKYYYYFKDSRNYSVLDMVDIIEEDYTEKSKDILIVIEDIHDTKIKISAI